MPPFWYFGAEGLSCYMATAKNTLIGEKLTLAAEKMVTNVIEILNCFISELFMSNIPFLSLTWSLKI